MKYIKHFEDDFYENNRDMISIKNIFDYLDIPMFSPFLDADQNNKIETKYNVNVIDYLKEIFLTKKVTFKSVNKPENNPIKKGVVEDIKFFFYQDEIYIQFKIESRLEISKWYIVSDEMPVYLGASTKYDADDKSLHKKVKIAKEAEKYNL